VDISPEQVLEELLEIRRRLDRLAPDAPQRADLQTRRTDLRGAAQEAADAARNPDNLRAELEHLEQRLAGFEGEKINVPAWQMAMTSGGRWSINDPAAYASKLNEALDAATELDRNAIEDRINQLRTTLGPAEQ
jgi:hypothetical protein